MIFVCGFISIIAGNVDALGREVSALKTFGVDHGSMRMDFDRRALDSLGVTVVTRHEDADNSTRFQVLDAPLSDDSSISFSHDDALVDGNLTALTGVTISDGTAVWTASPLNVRFAHDDTTQGLTLTTTGHATAPPIVVDTVATHLDLSRHRAMIVGDILWNAADSGREQDLWLIGTFEVEAGVTARNPGAEGQPDGTMAESQDASNSGGIAGTVGPDLIVDQIGDVRRWGWASGKTGYSLWTKACNIGDESASWVAGTDRKPLIAQNMYRLKDGRLLQVGMSWLKHGFFADDDDCAGNDPNTCFGDPLGRELPPLCADSYSTQLNGSQLNLGPRYQVNATTGHHIYPFDAQGFTGDPAYKRLQVADEFMDPDLNPDAIYFVEAHYVAEDDATAGNQDNNASYAPLIRIDELVEGEYEAIGPAGDATEIAIPGIFAWEDYDDAVSTVIVDIPGDRRLYVASKSTDLGNGQWRYDYAIQNLNSDRSVRSVSVPAPDATDIGFHDVDSHSGDGDSPFGSYYDNTDWEGTNGCGSFSWATKTWWADERTNALRWGEMYNYWFTSTGAPEPGEMQIGIFKPGTPMSMSVPVTVPALGTTSLIQCSPAHAIIDAGQPFAPDGSSAPTAPVQFVLAFNQDVAGLGTGDFEIAQDGGNGPAPEVIAVDNVSANAVQVDLDMPVEAGAWTTLTFVPSGQSTTMGLLPGDVDGNRQSDATDITTLINMLENPSGQPVDLIGDINRDGLLDPADLLREIDLLNGGDQYDAYFGQTLP
ncbi:MAG: hypothetical protein ACYTHJ_20090 [Planctomycetota bacterium]|jgi:hypothetical protein